MAEEIQAKIQAIRQAIQDRLGLTIPSSGESLKAAYKCERCHDTGWIEIQDESGRQYVQKCACRLAREAEQRLAASGLAASVGKQTFEAFETRTPIQTRIKETAEKYLATLLSPDIRDNPRRPWLYIGGNPGSGKTHICTAVCGELLRHNIGVKYMQWLSEARKLKAGVNDEDFEDQVTDYTRFSVLYIDDLLKQKYTDRPTFTEADIKIAFTILNARYLLNKPTIISSEWDLLEHLLPADEGVFSRVYERCKGYTVTIPRDLENNYRLTESGGTV